MLLVFVLFCLPSITWINLNYENYMTVSLGELPVLKFYVKYLINTKSNCVITVKCQVSVVFVVLVIIV